ncbi:MAG: hypothetical protein WAW17_29150 [Rhodococcus sp. (in: high G+C Gram-positive bacteria)]
MVRQFHHPLVYVLLVAGPWWLFEWERAHGADLAEARTVASLRCAVRVRARRPYERICDASTFS